MRGLSFPDITSFDLLGRVGPDLTNYILSQFPKACLTGDHVAIAIPEADYMAGIDACKHNLHGRIMLPKGSSPLSIDGLKSKLSALWKSIGKWGLTSLGTSGKKPF